MQLSGRLPFPDGSVDAVYASHVLEHLHHDEALSLLAECRRVLKRQVGVIRLVLPDARRMAMDYVASVDPEAVLRFNRGLMMRPMTRTRGPRRLYEALADLHSHKFMYDQSYLTRLLENCGFKEVEARGFLESRIPEVADVEDAGRVLDGAGFIVEALT